ncbi:DUF502 domain-containing protein [Algihabitans albus]|uniref:DUF502 domain-containing protein n=1 Tax=Algihabitans albus TaxID=2164067 RepID=UPI001F207597|nr:DUF502 domain-containing protein [Algihabitans albus]
MTAFRKSPKPDSSGRRPPRPRPAARPGLAVRLRNYFFAGVLIAAPLGITIWLTWGVVSFVDARVTPLVPARWNPETYLPFGLPGLGLIVVLIFLVLVGMLFTGIAGRMVMRQFERLLDQVPVVRSIYGAVKQIFETVLAQRSQAFREVALVQYPQEGCWAIGFVTGVTKGEVQRLTDETLVSVFVPATPNPTTGFLLFLPSDEVNILDMTVEQGLKLVVSGGIVVPPADARPSQNDAIQRLLDEQAEAKSIRPGLPQRLRNYLLAGILVTAPAAITFWLAWQFIAFVDARVTPWLPAQWRPDDVLPFGLPGLGLLIVFVGLTVIGMFAAGIVGRWLMRTSEWILGRVPVVRSLYSAVKQIFETVLAARSDAFRDCVLIQYPRPGSWAIGFITGKTEGHIQEITDEEVVNVFLPTTPNPTSGFLLFLPRDEITDLVMSVEEGLKMVVSAGIVTPPDRTNGEKGKMLGDDLSDPLETVSGNR